MILNLFLVNFAVAVKQVQIYPVSKTIRQVTTYNMAFKPSSTIPSGSELQVVFPQEFTQLPSGLVDCQVAGLESSCSPECSFSGSTFKLLNCFPSTSSTITVDLDSITNPTYAVETESFEVYFVKDSKMLEEKTTGISLEFDAVEMTQASFTPGSQKLVEQTQWTLSFTTTIEVPASGVIELEFPSWNENMGANPEEVKYFCDGSINCVGTKGLIGSIACSCDKGKVQMQLTTQASPGEISMTLESIRNPPSTSVFTGFVITTLYNSGKIEKTPSDSIRVQVTETSGLEIYELSTSGSKVNQEVTYRFFLYCSAPVGSDYKLEVTFPGEISIESTTMLGIIGVGRESLVYSVEGQKFLMSQGFTGYLEQRESIEFNLLKVKNPGSNKPTDYIQAAIMDSSDYTVCETSDSSSKKITAAPGSISNIQITPQDSTVQEETVYTFSFVPDEQLFRTSAIKVTFPDQVKIANQATSPCHGVVEGLDPNSKCQVTDSKYLYITEGFQSLFQGKISFSEDSVTNPEVTSETDSFQIDVYSDSSFNYLIVTDASVKITPTPGELSSGSVSYTSLTTGDTTDYTFELETAHKIPAGGYVKIELPDSISVSLGSSECFEPYGFSPGYSCTFTTNSISVEGGFASEYFGQLSLKVSNLKNPPTSQTSSSIKYYTQYNSFTIDRKLEGITVTMEVPNEFQSLRVESQSEVVGQTTNFIVYLDPFNLLYDGSHVLVKFPPELSVPSSPECFSNNNLLKSVSCTLEPGDLLKAALSFTSTVHSEVVFGLRSVKNPPSTKPTSSFSVSSYIGSYFIDSTKEGVQLTASAPAEMPGSVTLDNYLVTQTTNYHFKLETLHLIPSGGYLRVVIPESISTTDSLDCLYKGASVPCNQQDQVTLLLYIFESELQPSNLEFSILGLKNPPNSVTLSGFEITSKEGIYLIDRSSSIQVEFKCTSPCSECKDSPTSCTTCLENYYLYESKCLSTCPKGTFESGTECKDCSDNCADCETEANNCTECQDPPKLYNGNCVEECNESTFESQNVCYDCSKDCKRCQDSADFCTECVQDYLLYENTCVDECPGGISLLIDGKCKSCTDNCYTCSESTSTCTSCSTEFALYDKACIEECPKGWTSIDSVCKKCSGSCSECSDSVNNCTACEGSLYLSEGTCVESCPEGTALIGGTCQKCSENCYECQDFAQKCTSCYDGKLLHQGTCVEECPGSYAVIENICQECQLPCSECKGSASNCTACSNGLVLYKSQCFQSCPEGVSIFSETQCIECEVPCRTCRDSVDYCTSCASGFLHEGKCLETCPENYYPENSECRPVPCAPSCTEELLSNLVCDEECNTEACGFDNGKCEKNYSEDLLLKEAPFPFSICEAAIVGVVLASKFIQKSTQLVSGIVGLSVLIQTASWYVVIGLLGESKHTHGRELLENSEISLVFYLFLACIIIFILLNFAFCGFYWYLFLKHDSKHLSWVKSQPLVKYLVLPLAVLVNFNVIRLVHSELFSLKFTKADFGSKILFLKLLNYGSYISFVITMLPVIGVLIGVLVEFSSGHMVFLLALDSLVVSVLVLVLTVYNIVATSIIIHKEPKTITTVSVEAGPAKDTKFSVQNFKVWGTEDVLETERSIADDRTINTNEPEEIILDKPSLTPNEVTFCVETNASLAKNHVEQIPEDISENIEYIEGSEYFENSEFGDTFRVSKESEEVEKPKKKRKKKFKDWSIYLEGGTSLDAIYLQRLEPAKKQRAKSKRFMHMPFNPNTDSITNLNDSSINRINTRPQEDTQL